METFEKGSVVYGHTGKTRRGGVSFYYKGFRDIDRKLDEVEGEQMKSIVMEKTLY